MPTRLNMPPNELCLTERASPLAHIWGQIVTEQGGEFRSATSLDGPEGPSYGRFQNLKLI